MPRSNELRHSQVSNQRLKVERETHDENEVRRLSLGFLGDRAEIADIHLEHFAGDGRAGLLELRLQD